jgi:ABC-type uncharacterized transport system permease subunit
MNASQGPSCSSYVAPSATEQGSGQGVVVIGLAMIAVVAEPVPESSCCRLLALIAVLIGAWTVELIIWKYAIALFDSTDTEFDT